MQKNNSIVKSNQAISFVETPTEIVQLMVSLISKGKNAAILDTGSGKGAFLRELEKNGFFNIDAVELNNNFFLEIKQQYSHYTIVNADFLIWKAQKKYDVIIGNPPYLHFNSLPPGIQAEVFGITGTAESDIYYAFIIRAIELLQENGELIYIVPYGFFYNTHAKLVRKKIIDNGCIDLVIDLDETKLFIEENPETVIFRFRKIKKKCSSIDIARVKSKKTRPSDILKGWLEVALLKQSNDLFWYYKKDPFSTADGPWSSYPEIELLTSLKLKELAFIGVGLVSGYDQAFRIADEEVQKFSVLENKLIFKFIKASNCKGYWVEGCAYYIVLDTTIKSEQELQEFYPNIFRRLLPHKARMQARYLPNKEWFQWMALRNQKSIDSYSDQWKIFVPTLDRSKTNRFSICEDKLYPAGDTLIIIPQKISPYFLLGYLNSSFFRNYYLSNGARKGERISYTQKILSEIAIPFFKPEIVTKIENMTKHIFYSHNDSQRYRIDELIDYAIKEKLFAIPKPALMNATKTKQSKIDKFL